MARILIVDDDEATSQLLALVLSDAGEQDVSHAPRGRDALTQLATSATDLIILDMHLPDMDGLTLLQEARSGGYLGPVLVLTGSPRIDPLMKRIEAEPNPPAFLQKPFDIDEVTRVVLALVQPQGLASRALPSA